jgi:hypothetical protein
VKWEASLPFSLLLFCVPERVTDELKDKRWIIGDQKIKFTGLTLDFHIAFWLIYPLII